MRMKLTQTLMKKFQPEKRRVKIRDTVLPGLVLFVEPSGRKIWYIDYKRQDGRRADHKLGAVEFFTVAEARTAARKFLATVCLGSDPTIISESTMTYKEFLEQYYVPWFLTTHKAGGRSLEMLQHEFIFLHNIMLKQITTLRVEQWRAEKKQRGAKCASINRCLSSLHASLNWAVKNKIMSVNPIATVNKLPERDSVPRVRYLSAEERDRLMLALEQREGRIREKRGKYETSFADYLKPLVLISLNTGVRRGALLALEWRDVDFGNRILTLRAGIEKSGKGNKIPLNAIAFQTLSAWQSQSLESNLIFPSPKNGKVMLSCYDAWKDLLEIAGIQDFRWHDMRHDFASQLVMKGVSLNTVRELLGHSDLKITLRYAHLAPQVTRAAAYNARERGMRRWVLESCSCVIPDLSYKLT